ncbi:hypothetical protein STIAU_0232, partial [Stigmatella aurantiaca DW4/3-1]
RGPLGLVGRQGGATVGELLLVALRPRVHGGHLRVLAGKREEQRQGGGQPKNSQTHR